MVSMRKTAFFIMIGWLIHGEVLFSQDCESDYTFFSTIPDNVLNVNNDDNCFFNDDITFMNDLISSNSLSYDTPLELGTQTWVSSRLTSLVATYTPNGSNGVNEKISELPSTIGNLTNLSSLYIEWNDLTELPESFGLLTSLTNLAISNNYLTSIPNINNLTNLIFLDLGYNQINSMPESIGSLQNLEYLWIFNNQLSSLPETICNLPLDWDGIDPSNYPYFAAGANQLCESSLIPDCVENSANFEISLDQFYYSFLEETPQNCTAAGCMDPEAYNCDGSLNGDYVTYIGEIQYDNSCTACESGEVCEGYYDPNVEVSNGICYYYQAPTASEVDFSIQSGSILLDWSAFSPPSLSNVIDYRLTRCADLDGTGLPLCEVLEDGIITSTNYEDDFDFNESDYIQYILSVNYENNPYWGWANSGYLDAFCSALGDLNDDYYWNVLDIVALANCVLASDCSNLENGCAGDMNSDGTWNVLDIVALANCVLASNCG